MGDWPHTFLRFSGGVAAVCFEVSEKRLPSSSSESSNNPPQMQSEVSVGKGLEGSLGRREGGRGGREKEEEEGRTGQEGEREREGGEGGRGREEGKGKQQILTL